MKYDFTVIKVICPQVVLEVNNKYYDVKNKEVDITLYETELVALQNQTNEDKEFTKKVKELKKIRDEKEQNISYNNVALDSKSIAKLTAVYSTMAFGDSTYWIDLDNTNIILTKEQIEEALKSAQQQVGEIFKEYNDARNEL